MHWIVGGLAGLQKTVSGGSSMSYDDLEKFVAELKTVRGLAPGDTVDALLVRLNAASVEQRTLVTNAFNKALGRAATFDQVIGHLTKFRDAVKGFLLANQPVFEEYQLKMLKFQKQLEFLSRLAKSPDAKLLLENVTNAFVDVMREQARMQQKAFKYAAQPLNDTVDADKPVIIANLIKLATLVGNVVIEKQPAFNKQVQLIREAKSVKFSRSNAHQIAKRLVASISLREGSLSELQDCLGIVLDSIAACSGECRELDELNSLLKMIGSKNGGDLRPGKSLIEAQQNQQFRRNANTKAFKNHLNNEFCKIAAIFYRVIEASAGYSQHNIDHVIVDTIQLIIELFHGLVDNSSATTQVLDQLRESKELNYKYIKTVEDSIRKTAAAHKPEVGPSLAEAADVIARLHAFLLQLDKTGRMPDDSDDSDDQPCPRTLFNETKDILIKFRNIVLIRQLDQNIKNQRLVSEKIDSATSRQQTESQLQQELIQAEKALEKVEKLLESDKVKYSDDFQTYAGELSKHQFHYTLAEQLKHLITDSTNNRNTASAVATITRNPLYTRIQAYLSGASPLKVTHTNFLAVKLEIPDKYFEANTDAKLLQNDTVQNVLEAWYDDVVASVPYSRLLEELVAKLLPAPGAALPSAPPRLADQYTDQFKKTVTSAIEKKRDAYRSIKRLAIMVEEAVSKPIKDLSLAENKDLLSKVVQYIAVDTGNDLYKLSKILDTQELSSAFPGAIRGGSSLIDDLQEDQTKVRDILNQSVSFLNIVRLFSACGHLFDDGTMSMRHKEMDVLAKRYMEGSLLRINDTMMIPAAVAGITANDKSYTMPGFLTIRGGARHAHAGQQLSSIVRASSETDRIDALFDSLFDDIMKAMSQRVMTVLSMYRIYHKKRLDLQYPKILVGGEDVPRDLSNSDCELIYRAVLLCEYYHDFFREKTADKDDLIMYIRPVDDNPAGSLLQSVFMCADRKIASHQYSANDLNAIATSVLQLKHTGNVYHQIQNYVNENYGVLPQDDLDQLNAISSDSGSDIYALEDDGSYSTPLQRNKQPAASFYKQTKKLIDENIQKLYEVVVNQHQENNYQGLYHGFRAFRQELGDKPAVQKRGILLRHLNEKGALLISSKDSKIHETLKFALYIAQTINQRYEFALNILKNVVTNPCQFNSRAMYAAIATLVDGMYVTAVFDQSRVAVDISPLERQTKRLLDALVNRKPESPDSQLLEAAVKKLITTANKISPALNSVIALVYAKDSLISDFQALYDHSSNTTAQTTNAAKVPVKQPVIPSKPPVITPNLVLSVGGVLVEISNKGATPAVSPSATPFTAAPTDPIQLQTAFANGDTPSGLANTASTNSATSQTAGDFAPASARYVVASVTTKNGNNIALLILPQSVTGSDKVGNAANLLKGLCTDPLYISQYAVGAQYVTYVVTPGDPATVSGATPIDEIVSISNAWVGGIFPAVTMGGQREEFQPNPAYSSDRGSWIPASGLRPVLTRSCLARRVQDDITMFNNVVCGFLENQLGWLSIKPKVIYDVVSTLFDIAYMPLNEVRSEALFLSGVQNDIERTFYNVDHNLNINSYRTVYSAINLHTIGEIVSPILSADVDKKLANIRSYQDSVVQDYHYVDRVASAVVQFCSELRRVKSILDLKNTLRKQLGIQDRLGTMLITEVNRLLDQAAVLIVQQFSGSVENSPILLSDLTIAVKWNESSLPVPFLTRSLKDYFLNGALSQDVRQHFQLEAKYLDAVEPLVWIAYEQNNTRRAASLYANYYTLPRESWRTQTIFLDNTTLDRIQRIYGFRVDVDATTTYRPNQAIATNGDVGSIQPWVTSALTPHDTTRFAASKAAAVKANNKNFPANVEDWSRYESLKGYAASVRFDLKMCDVVVVETSRLLPLSLTGSDQIPVFDITISEDAIQHKRLFTNKMNTGMRYDTPKRGVVPANYFETPWEDTKFDASSNPVEQSQPGFVVCQLEQMHAAITRSMWEQSSTGAGLSRAVQGYNICDIGVIPINYLLMKRDLPLVGVLANARLFDIYEREQREGADFTAIAYDADADQNKIILANLCTVLHRQVKRTNVQVEGKWSTAHQHISRSVYLCDFLLSRIAKYVLGDSMPFEGRDIKQGFSFVDGM